MKSWFLLLVCSPCISKPAWKLFGLSMINSIKDSIYRHGTGKISVFLYNKTSKVCNIEAHSCSHFCCGKAISITYPTWVSVAFVTQHAMWMHYIVLSPVAYLAVPCFPNYLTNSTIFWKKLLNIKCVFSGCALKMGTE